MESLIWLSWSGIASGGALRQFLALRSSNRRDLSKSSSVVKSNSSSQAYMWKHPFAPSLLSQASCTPNKYSIVHVVSGAPTLFPVIYGDICWAAGDAALNEQKTKPTRENCMRALDIYMPVNVGSRTHPEQPLDCRVWWVVGIILYVSQPA